MESLESECDIRRGGAVHGLIAVFLLLFLGACAHLPEVVPDAPKQDARAVVFDIDGTLTPTPFKYWKARPDAARAVQLFADRGFEIVYLSARARALQTDLSPWLTENGFPPGGIYVTQSGQDRRDHARFKARVLREFMARGWTVAFAFGDSSTDFQAYAAVGIPRGQVFALKRQGQADCQPGVWAACLNGWTEYIRSVAK